MQQSQYAFSNSETVHFFGLCLLLGSMLVIDLRLLGLLKRTHVSAALKFVPVAIIGFLLNLVTGVLFLFYNPEGYVTNWLFQLKMGLILLAGVNMLYFTLVEQPRVLKTPVGEPFDRVTRISAILSLTLWTVVIVAGRLLPVTQGAAGKG
jgi:uncharacterized membrane protein